MAIRGKDVLSGAGLGAIAVAAVGGLWLLGRRKTKQVPVVDLPDIGPDDPLEDPTDDPAVEPPPKKPTPHQPIYFMAPWDEPGPDDGVPWTGRTFVGHGDMRDADNIVYMEWRLWKTPITFACNQPWTELCQYVLQSRGVKDGWWETIKKDADQPFFAEQLEFHRLTAELDYQWKKGLIT